MRIYYTMLVIIIICSCNLDKDLKHIEISQNNDTIIVFNTMLDSLFKLNTKGFDNPLNPKNGLLKDTIVFFRDSIYSRYLDSLNFRIKIVSENKICELFSIRDNSFNKKERDNYGGVIFSDVFRFDYYNFGDTTVAGIINYYGVISKFNDDGTIRILPTSGPINSKFDCHITKSSRIFDCSFIKSNNKLKLLKRRTPGICFME